MKKSDWLSSKREDRLAMAERWLEYGGENFEAWNIPAAAFTKLNAATLAAKSANSVPAGSRNAMTNAKLKTAFAEMVAQMRDMKKRYFYDPPLTEVDFAALGLKPKDTIPTSVADPVGLATATVKYPNEGALELHIKHTESTPMDERANYGFRIYFGVYATDEVPPDSGEDLRESRFTRQKKELFTFRPKDSGKRAYFSIRYENSKGKAGQWGHLISAIIP